MKRQRIVSISALAFVIATAKSTLATVAGSQHLRAFAIHRQRRYATIQGGVQDKNEKGMEGITLELHTPGHQHIVDYAVETGPDGTYEFVVDALDLDNTTRARDVTIQVIPPQGYRTLTSDSSDYATVSLLLGETYTLDFGLAPACDKARGKVSFSGVTTANSFQPGNIHMQWAPALLRSHDKNKPFECSHDDVNYNILLAQAPFDYSTMSAEELRQLSHNDESGKIHIFETDEDYMTINDLEPGETYDVLVVANAGGMISDNREQRRVVVLDVSDDSNHSDGDDEVEDEEIPSQTALHRRMKEIPDAIPFPVINEVLFKPDPNSRDRSRQRAFVEIFLPDTSYSLNGCQLQNSDGSFRVEFNESIASLESQYLSIRHKSTIDEEFLLRSRKGILWMRDFLLYEVDGVALFCDGEMIDYVGWGNKDTRPNGYLQFGAFLSGGWSAIDEYIDTSSVDLGGGYVSPGLGPGDSLGRDSKSTDTNSPQDWTLPGGWHARRPTPSSQNLEHSSSPLINELLFLPDEQSKDIMRRRVFIEIYRPDPTYSLNGCIVVNDNESLLVSFDKTFDRTDKQYITVKHKSVLTKESHASRKQGVLWMRNMNLNETADGVALVCHGMIIDYVAYGAESVGPNGSLHASAVKYGMWNDTSDFVETNLGTYESVREFYSPVMSKGDSIGRDGASLDTNTASDWSISSPVRGPTPSASNWKHTALPLINEVLYLPDEVDSRNLKGKRMFVEIYRADPSYSLSGCTIVSDGGSFRVDFDKPFKSLDDAYFSIKHKSELKSKQLLKRNQGILWVSELLLHDVDGLALFCDGSMVDYVAWKHEEYGPSGSHHADAVARGMWSGLEDYVQTAPVDYGNGFLSPGITGGIPLARDGISSDTNSPLDWAVGGLDARGPTPSSRNREYLATPLINEVLFSPSEGSSDFSERRKFVEIYRADPMYSLSGCSLISDKGSFQFTIEEGFDRMDSEYFSVKHRATLKSDSLLKPRQGTLWVKKLDLHEIDGLALFCDNTMVDYLAWGRDFVGPNGNLHNAAVSNGMWNDSNEFIETGFVGGVDGFRVRGVQQGDSIGRDPDSTDTNSASDWWGLGGSNSTQPTPSKRNLDPFFAYFTTEETPALDLDATTKIQEKKDLTIISLLVNHYDDKGFYRNPDPMKDLASDTARAMLSILVETDPSKVHFVAQYGKARFYFSDSGAIKSSVTEWRPDSAETLSELVTWAKKHYPAEKYILHMSGHGGGWKGMNIARGRDKTTRSLSMADMRKGLTALGEKFAVIFLDACLMGGLEVAYQIRDQAEYVTFSEEAMITGIDWKRLTKSLVTNRKQNSKFLATLFASEYQNSISNKFTECTISVVELAQIEAVKTGLDTFATALTADMSNVETHDKKEDNLNVVWAKDILDKAEDFSCQDYVDLSDLARLTKDSPADFAAKASAAGVMEAVERAVVISYPGPSEAAEHKKATGMHIYHPQSLMQDFQTTKTKRDNAYTSMWPSKTVYALDKQARVPGHVYEKEHTHSSDPGFLLPIDSTWDEFLIRFYKPTADACIRISETECVQEAEVKFGRTVTVSGSGSSDTDPASVEGNKWRPGHAYLKYFWDLDLLKDDPRQTPKYKEGNKYISCREDCDRDDSDTTFDDADIKTTEWPFTCNEENAGKTFEFKLHVWDDHNLWNREWNENTRYNRGRHWLHFQVDSAQVKLKCDEAPITNGPTPEPLYAPTPTSPRPTPRQTSLAPVVVTETIETTSTTITTTVASSLVRASTITGGASSSVTTTNSAAVSRTDDPSTSTLVAAAATTQDPNEGTDTTTTSVNGASSSNPTVSPSVAPSSAVPTSPVALGRGDSRLTGYSTQFTAPSPSPSANETPFPVFFPMDR